VNTQIYEFVIQSLARWKGHWPQVADETGVPIRTIEKIATKKTKNPGIKTCEILAAYFAEKPVFETKKRR
jgi:transcriptional regulator with XRE-family HTH domain